MVACRFTSVQRSGLQASRKPPFRFHPVARPVSCSEPVIEVDRVAEELGDVGAGAQLTDEAGGVPGRAACQLPALEKEHVAEPHLAEMIGDRAADDAAADDDDLRGRRQLAHARSMVR